MRHNIYDENESSESSKSNRDSYGDVFDHKNNYGIGNQANKLSSTGGAGMYDLSKVKNNMFGNFGNTGANLGNFGQTAQVSNMIGPFANTGGIGNDIYNINLDLDTDKYKDEKKEDKKIIKEDSKKNKKDKKKKKNDFLDQIEDELGDSSLNKTPYGSKIDFTDQSQKISKSKNKILEEKEEEEEEKEEEKNEENESIPEIKDEDQKKYENQNLLNEIKKLRNENIELIKDKEGLEKTINQKNQNLDEIRNDYNNYVKSIELKIINRENRNNENLQKDIEIKYQTELIKKESEIENLKNEYGYLENRYNSLNDEYKKIKDNKENNEKLYELKNENYRLYEQLNEMKQKQKQNMDLELLHKENNKSDAKKVYEQMLNEREIDAQEKLLNNYLKEIKKLNEEIYFLKTVPPGYRAGVGQKQKSNVNNIEMTLNNINYKKPNTNYVINPSLQESAEKQIKKLQNFLLPSSPNDINNNKMLLMEKEFNRLQNKESPNEITFDNFIAVMRSLQVPLSSNELIEIFNNFPRIKGNRIRMNDFINALNSKVPSSFFLQSDPSYLNELESKLIKGQNRIKELEKFILVNNNENEEFKEQLKKSMNENKLLKNKINDLNSQILQYFLFREEKNLSNPDVIQMKEKMKNFELKNKTMNNELSEKFGKYEKKIEELKKTYEDERINLLKEKDGYKDQINKLKSEKEKVKNEFDKKEIKYKTEIDQLNEKLLKYKKNYNILMNKNENNKKEKEKILNSFKDR